jgi:uncharacterized coiled-coil protein SlyX
MTKEQKLNEQVNEQQNAISKLYDRLSRMSDRIVTLEGEVAYFKKEVSGDVKAIVEHLKKKNK